MPINAADGQLLTALSHIDGAAIATISAVDGDTTGGGGGSAPTFVDADQGTAGSTTTVSTDNALSVSGTNRYVIASLLTLDFGSVTHDDVDVGALSLDEVGTTHVDGSGFYRRSSSWAGFAPATGSQATSGTVSASATTLGLVASVYQNVHQTTPRGTVYQATGFYDGVAGGTASVMVTGAVAGDRIVAEVFLKDENASPRSLSGGDAVRAQLPAPDAGQVGHVEFTAAGTDPTVAVTISGGSGEGGGWLIRAYKLNPP